MNYVLDSSVAFKWVVSESDSSKARQLRDDFLAGQIQFLAPDFFPYELLHAIVRAERQGRVPVGHGGIFWPGLMQICPILHTVLPLATRSYEIATQARIGIYNCLYVALAEREGCEFITADDRLVRNLQPQFPWINALSAIP